MISTIFVSYYIVFNCNGKCLEFHYFYFCLKVLLDRIMLEMMLVNTYYTSTLVQYSWLTLTMNISVYVNVIYHVYSTRLVYNTIQKKIILSRSLK